MSKINRCDLVGCSNACEVFTLQIVKLDEAYDFCSPEHAVLWLFQRYEEMPLWYGPKRELEPANG